MQALGFRLAVVAVATLLAGLLLPATGHDGGFDGFDGPGRPVATVEAAAVTVASPALSGRGTVPAWRLALLRAATALLGFGLGLRLLALVGLRPGLVRPPAPAWQLARPDRAPATGRHCSPLAARRAPPAPARL
jgi:hypothetical protein